MKFLQNNYLKKFALWIKENSKVLNVIGAVFFLFTFIAGILWVFGKDVESISFIFSLLTSIFFGLPHLAEFILPARKPIKDMTFDELLNFIRESDSERDWHGINRNWTSEMFLKEDPRLRFRANFTDKGIQCEDFKEDWANCYPNPKATGYYYDLYFDGNLIERFILVSVDGGRSSLPIPDFYSKQVCLIDYKVAQIHDTLKTLDKYMNLSKLKLEAEDSLPT